MVYAIYIHDRIVREKIIITLLFETIYKKIARLLALSVSCLSDHNVIVFDYSLKEVTPNIITTRTTRIYMPNFENNCHT